MASDLLQLQVDIGTLPPAGAAETRQQFAESIAQRLLVYLPSANMTFNIGGSKPTSNEGPWFKAVTDPKSGNASYELWVWSDTAADYVLLSINQIQLRYYVGTTSPSQTLYDVWVKVSSSGQPLGILTYNTASVAWEPVSYTPAEIDAFFEGETGGGKKQVAWDSLTGVPASATSVPRSVTGTLGAGDAAYDWEQVYHTNIGQMVIYDPINSAWKTLSGGIGDIKFVAGTVLGLTSDFNGSTFNTVLGKNPGWTLDTASIGRVLVAADEAAVWDATTTQKKDPQSTYGTGAKILTVAQLPPHTHTLPVDAVGGEDVQSLIPSANADEDSDGGLSGSTGSGEAFSIVQESIAYYCIRKIL